MVELNLNLDEDDANIFENALRSIFGQPVIEAGDDDLGWSKFGSFFYTDREINSIVFPNTFYRYFSNQIFSHDIPDKDWYENFKLSHNKFLSK